MKRALVFGAIVASSVVAWLACGDDPAATSTPNDAATNEVSTTTDASVDAGPVRAPFGLDTRPANPSCLAPASPSTAHPIKLTQVYANVAIPEPMILAQPPNDPSRMFVATRGGQLLSFAKVNPGPTPTVVLDLTTLPFPFDRQFEGGFLGFAFHPKFKDNGRLYVSFTTGDGTIGNLKRSRIGYFTSADNGSSFAGYVNILTLEQFTGSHVGGMIAFGRDGFLYASFGDGNADPTNGQRKTGFASKILRLDVDNVPAGSTYGVPTTGNAFAPDAGEPAAFAYGFRNPFRFSFDRDTGDLWAGDVGLQSKEEIDVVRPAGNYGWPCLEGTVRLNTTAPECSDAGVLAMTPPVHEYERLASFRAVIGGAVYRGKAMPGLVGRYVFGDEINGEMWILDRDRVTGAVAVEQVNDGGAINPNWVAFSEDLDGEIYGVGLQGRIYKLEAAEGQPPPSTFPDRLSKTGCFDAKDPKTPLPGLLPFGPNAAQFVDGAEAQRHVALPDGSTIKVLAEGNLELPSGSVVTQTFSVANKKIETRVLMRHPDGNIRGYSYEWLDDQSDALLLPASKKKDIGGREWTFPSRGECMLCHTQAAGRVLGLELGQLNGELLYPSTNRISNQLATLEHIGLFAAPLGRPPAELPLIPSPFGEASIELRARAYLHTQCASCHRPEGGTRSAMDLRFSTPFAATKTCNVESVTGDLSIEGAKLFVPKDPASSLVALRPHRRDVARMPPLGGTLIDDKGLAIVEAWINAVTVCP